MNKYIAIRPIRRIGSERMRSICIENNWYDSGTNEEYGHLLFDLCQRKKNLTDDDIVMIVLDIIAHTERFKGKDDPEIFDRNLFEVSELVFKGMTMYLTKEEL